MRDPIRSLVRALEQEPGGVAIVWCPDLGLREWLVSEVESIVPPETESQRVATASEAILVRERVVLLVPDDERGTILELDARRGQIGEPARTWPIVVFLLREGDGQRALAEEAVGLRSWVGGNVVDPEEIAEIDAEAERGRFEEETGHSPEDWLVRWRSGELPRTAVHLTRAYRAKLLENP